MMSGYPKDSGHYYIQTTATQQHKGDMSACQGYYRNGNSTKQKKGKRYGVLFERKIFEL